MNDIAAREYNQVHQEQIVETIEVIPQKLFQQCTIAPIMQGVTRVLRFAAESLRAEVSDLTRTLVQFRNDSWSWSARALSSLIFISRVMISKPGLQ